MTTLQTNSDHDSQLAQAEKPIPALCLEVGVVAIGRNEGERIDKCLRSAINQSRTVVYVDSGSTDDSTKIARRQAPRRREP